MSKAALLGIALVGGLALAVYKTQEAKAKSLPNGTIKSDEIVLLNGTVVRVSGFEQLFKGNEQAPAAELDKLKNLPKEVQAALSLFEDSGAPTTKYPAQELAVGDAKFLLLKDEDNQIHVYMAPKGKATVFETAL